MSLEHYCLDSAGIQTSGGQGTADCFGKILKYIGNTSIDYNERGMIALGLLEWQSEAAADIKRTVYKDFAIEMLFMTSKFLVFDQIDEDEPGDNNRIITGNLRIGHVISNLLYSQTLDKAMNLSKEIAPMILIILEGFSNAHMMERVTKDDSQEVQTMKTLRNEIVCTLLKCFPSEGMKL